MFYDDNSQLKLAWEFVQYTGNNIFLTGKAGTGKTTFLRNVRQSTLKRSVVVAPTGVAALNAGGVTIHSFFQLPFGPQLPGDQLTTEIKRHAAANQKFTREKINIIRSLDLLIIDEISMVRADLLDAIDVVLRRYRNRSKPFGGVQLLMIGDLQQLAPITKNDEWELLRPYYDSPFFFSSLALQKTVFTAIELKHIYRQNDQLFIDLLNKIRDNEPDSESLRILNERYNPRFNHDENPGYITLTTHNQQAEQMNEKRLEKIRSKKHFFNAKISGTFPEYTYPTLPKLELKTGAQVMFVKNDSSPQKRYYNGKIGIITGIDPENESITVLCNGDDEEINVTPEEWNNFSYSIDPQSNEIVEKSVGTFNQIPLKLAWAITIHKSQGLTFSKAIIDANAAFAHGQVYVALSRCTSLEGLVLSSRIEPYSIRSDTTVKGFTKNVEANQPDSGALETAKHEFEHNLVSELFDFKSLQKELSYLLKQMKDNASSLHLKDIEDLEKTTSMFLTDVVIISDKFQPQLQQLFHQEPDIEKNSYLQERIKKASAYFDEKIAGILSSALNRLSIETDNKAVKKTLSEILERLKEETRLKQACLKEGRTGITVQKYLRVRAVSAIDKEVRETVRTDERLSQHIANPDLYKALRQWRSNKAEEADIPEYMVLNQKSLAQLAQLLPCTKQELLAIKGIGKAKAKIFGDELAELIADYCLKTGLEPKRPASLKPVLEHREEKPDTRMLTFDLFKEGKNVEDIASIRKLTAGTIEGHLATFIRSGKIEINELVSEKKIELVTKFFNENNTASPGMAKQALGEQITWGELRMIIAYLNKQQQ